MRRPTRGTGVLCTRRGWLRWAGATVGWWRPHCSTAETWHPETAHSRTQSQRDPPATHSGTEGRQRTTGRGKGRGGWPAGAGQEEETLSPPTAARRQRTAAAAAAPPLPARPHLADPTRAERSQQSHPPLGCHQLTTATPSHCTRSQHSRGRCASVVTQRGGARPWRGMAVGRTSGSH